MTNISFIEDTAFIFSVVNSIGKTQGRGSHDISLDYFLEAVLAGSSNLCQSKVSKTALQQESSRNP